jgi:succinate dehydrogenase hydrophobic anchor subunit
LLAACPFELMISFDLMMIYPAIVLLLFLVAAVVHIKVWVGMGKVWTRYGLRMLTHLTVQASLNSQVLS